MTYLDYKNGITLLPYLDNLKDKTLINNPEWSITSFALLPVVKDTLLAYTPILDGASNGHWLANGVNHHGVYEISGIYNKHDGTHFNDDLTIYAILRNKTNPLHVEYKCEFLTHLIHTNEIKKEDIPNSVLQHL